MKDYVAGGYFIANYLDRPECMPSELLPDRILSASDCIVDIVPDAWAYRGMGDKGREVRERMASAMGIESVMLTQAMRWTEARRKAREFAWPDVFTSTKVASEFAHLFLRNSQDWALIGIGLHQTLVRTFTQEIAHVGEYGDGVHWVLSKGLALEPLAQVLGFEVLGFESGGFHSSLCHGLERDFFRHLGIRPNRSGFYDEFDDALRCAEYANRDDVPTEHVRWMPWLIVKYEMA
ncbi:MAG: hypothetical protein AB1696_00445 [Planctomycetota bacterium]